MQVLTRPHRQNRDTESWAEPSSQHKRQGKKTKYDKYSNTLSSHN